MSELLTLEEVARFLRVSQETARAAIHRGEIPHVRVGRQIRVPRDRFMADVLGVRTEQGAQ